jgi:aerobic C4-dicarboxylate transport protein
MSEARALTNFTGNTVASVLVDKWNQEVDLDRARQVLDGKLRFDESSMGGEAGGHPPQDEERAEPVAAVSAPAGGKPGAQDGGMPGEADRR